MAVRQASRNFVLGWVVGGVLFCGFAAGVVLIMFVLAGKFSPKVPARGAVTGSAAAAIDGQVVRASKVPLAVSESAVGTIRAVHEMAAGSKLLARVVEVNVKAGQNVKVDDVLARLDDTDLRAKFEQAKAAVTAAEAVRAQAAADEQRGASLLESNAISRRAYDNSVTTLRAAEADLLRTQQMVNEAQAALDWATIRSPFNGTVIDKKVDVGDMVSPGQPIVTLFDPTRMQLVANVRESLTRQLQVGRPIDVRIEALDKQCTGIVSEIVPQAQSSSRAFQVKVTGPCPEGIYSGMFGRIVIPLGTEHVLVIPRAAVRHVGQLELVQVVKGGEAMRRAIRTGRYVGDVRDSEGLLLHDQVEVLSGLQDGEQIAVPKDASRPPSTEVSPAADGQSTSSQEARHE